MRSRSIRERTKLTEARPRTQSLVQPFLVCVCALWSIRLVERDRSRLGLDCLMLLYKFVRLFKALSALANGPHCFANYQSYPNFVRIYHFQEILQRTCCASQYPRNCSREEWFKSGLLDCSFGRSFKSSTTHLAAAVLIWRRFLVRLMNLATGDRLWPFPSHSQQSAKRRTVEVQIFCELTLMLD